MVAFQARIVYPNIPSPTARCAPQPPNWCPNLQRYRAGSGTLDAAMRVVSQVSFQRLHLSSLPLYLFTFFFCLSLSSREKTREVQM